MMKFKINKTIDQISQISQNIRTLYARQKNYGNLNTKIAYKANLAPRELFEGSGTDYTMTNVFGGEIKLEASSKSSYDGNKAFVISFEGIPEEACIELATQDWGSDTSSGLIAVGVSTYLHTATLDDCDESTSRPLQGCPNSSTVPVPIPVDVAVDGCESSYGIFSIKFY